MTAYATIDYLPDLTQNQMSKAGILIFTLASENTSGWENTASTSGSAANALLHAVYKFTAREGAIYDIISLSYYDPTLLRLYDNTGNVIAINNEATDPADILLSDDGYYARDMIRKWIAPYSGTYYVNASWSQGIYFSTYALYLEEDLTPLAATEDISPPIVIKFTPYNGEIGVSVSTDITLIFNEAIERGSGYILISSMFPWSFPGTYDVATSNNISITGNVLTINPTDNLVINREYSISIDAGSIRDLAGNNYAGTRSYDFTTTDLALVPMIRNDVSVMPVRYTGPATAAGGDTILFEYIGDGSNEVLIGTAYNDFINVGAGVDAVDAGAGNDVIDGGTGSNFLTGGAGTDIFFSDGRGGATTWSTITDWQAGEQLSVWGWTPGTSKIVAWQQDGAAGYQGLTMHADLNGDGTIDTSVTFTGITSQSQLPTPLEFPGVLWFT
jgi:Ca2+-binding RTX toxin-like protein